MTFRMTDTQSLSEEAMSSENQGIQDRIATLPDLISNCVKNTHPTDISESKVHNSGNAKKIP